MSERADHVGEHQGGLSEPNRVERTNKAERARALEGTKGIRASQ
jgi:hypothetical protein